MTPASDGPKMRDALKRLELSAIAFGSASRPTILYVSCWRDGTSSTRTSPFRNAIVYSIHGSATPLTAINASATAVTSWPICVPITSRRASSRSVSTPAKSPKSVNGRNCASAMIPTANGSPCVSWRTNQLSAIRCIQEPVWEMAWPAKKSR